MSTNRRTVAKKLLIHIYTYGYEYAVDPSHSILRVWLLDTDTIHWNTQSLAVTASELLAVTVTFCLSYTHICQSLTLEY
ncbi:hypothetical protein BOTCAL_0001g00850 [Botryotinia calthae]|uniref:Uncharacterized protein n=1 Tax=Botryotinia calthae TaxID=38488 RepID=A0A4Y8DIB8_9HELO|nr:hypothetical protein BOTCAL_0001g00850 [Botryotinia calthae]